VATDFTVILFQRQQFGRRPGAFDDVEARVPFAGQTRSFTFDCPGVDSNETAFLLFQSRDVDHPNNVLQMNGLDVFGGLPVSPARDAWNSNVLLVEPRHSLLPAGNVLRVESRDARGQPAGDLDDFIVDNVVITYKTRDVALVLPWATGDLAAFVKGELLPSIAIVKGSGATADPADQHNEYILPTSPQLGAWRTVFRSLLAGAWAQAHVQARMISETYNVVRFLDAPSGRTYFVVMEGVPGRIPAPAAHATAVSIGDPADPGRRGWGTYVFAQQPQRAVSFSAPHPKDDLETADEALEAYLAIQGRTLLIAGTDRDQNTVPAACEQSSRPYLQADVGHTAESVFQIAFEEIYSSDLFTWHVQFHGNSTCAPDVFLSNGVTAAPALVRTLAANIEAASRAAAAGGPVLTVDVFDGPGDCSARGTDNMQLRFASGLPHTSICTPGNVPIGPSRFVHVEQRRDPRRAPDDPSATSGRNRAVVVAGILATFS
jgi:hypothetical protein